MRTINEFPTYKVSVCGKVFSRFGKELRPQLDKNGYHSVQLHNGNKKRVTRKVHRLVCQAFLPNFYGKLQVEHKNKIRCDNRLFNLKWRLRNTDIVHKTVAVVYRKTVIESDSDSDSDSDYDSSIANVYGNI